MQIVINIDDEDYKTLVQCGENVIDLGLLLRLRNLVRESKPLPKGHGKIGDLDRLYSVFEKNVVSADAFKELFDYAPTIIEADRSEDEG